MPSTTVCLSDKVSSFRGRPPSVTHDTKRCTSASALSRSACNLMRVLSRACRAASRVARVASRVALAVSSPEMAVSPGRLCHAPGRDSGYSGDDGGDGLNPYSQRHAPVDFVRPLDAGS
jgi:hypothetical protein